MEYRRSTNRKKIRHLDADEIRRILTFPETRREFRQRHPELWRRMVRTGTWGDLVSYLGFRLNRWMRRPLAKLPIEGRLRALQADVIQSFPKGLLARDLYVPALLESLAFSRFGFVPLWCKHGKHWYLSDDRRREDCVEHRYAGQKARARTPTVWARELARRKEQRKRRKPRRRA
jgi:hypothetical protein